MRALYLCSDLGIPLDGHKGAAAHVRGFVSAMRALNIETQVVSPNGGGHATTEVEASDLFANLDAAIPKRMSRALRHISSNALVEKALEMAIENERPDFIYERYSPFAIAGGIVAEAHKIPHILEVNAPLSREGATFRAQALPDVAIAMENRAYELAGHIVTVSEELRQELIRADVPKGKITAIPNGVDVSRFAKDVVNGSKRDHDNKIVVGFVGSLKPWHDVDSLLKVFKALLVDERIHFCVVGDGPEMKKIRAFEKDHADRITVTGAMNHHEVPAQLAQMDIALAPYPVMEGFYFSPLKILEYMAAGCAIVSSEIGQTGSLISHGETGLLVPAGDPKAMADAVCGLAENDDMRSALGKNAAVEARDKHDWKSRVQDVLSIAESMGA